MIVVDDSQKVRERFAALLAHIPGLEVVAQAGDVSSALLNLRDLRPDAMLLRSRPPRRQRIRSTGSDRARAARLRRHRRDQSANVMDVLEVVRNMTEARSRKIETNDESRRPFEELESKQ